MEEKRIIDWLKETKTDVNEYYNYVKKNPKNILIEMGDIKEEDNKEELLRTLKKIKSSKKIKWKKKKLKKKQEK